MNFHMSRLPVSLPRPTKHFGRRALLVIVPIPIPSQEDPDDRIGRVPRTISE
jgi:hypothetical protein